MLKKETVVDEVARRIAPDLASNKFVQKKGALDFVRRGGELNYFFEVYAHPMTEWFKVQTAVYVGCAKINRLLVEIIGRGPPAGGNTCGYGIWNRHSGRGNYQIDGPGDFDAVAASVAKDFTEIALPFVATLADINDVDRFLNARNPAGRYVPESVSWACKGLIAAKLCGNPDYPILVREYYNLCVASQGVALAKPVAQTRDYLEANHKA